MKVTIQQIADKAGVSRGTVDRALNNRGRVDSEVAEKILVIADEMGYVHKKRKRAKQTGQVKIGVVTQLARASFMLEINRGIREASRELKDRGVELILEEGMSVDEGEQLAAIDRLLEQGIDGLALMPVDCEGIRSKINQIVEMKKIPVVTFNSDIVGTKRSCFVGMDNRKSGHTAAGLMGMMTRNNGKVLVITGFFSNNVNNMRVDGIIEELKRSFPDMELAGVQTSFDETSEVERIIVNTMLGQQGIAGIVVVSGGQLGIARAFQKLKLERRPYVIVYDLTPKNEKLLRENVADFLIDQEGYTQGHRPIYVLADMIQKNEEPESEYMYTDINIKTKYNI